AQAGAEAGRDRAGVRRRRPRGDRARPREVRAVRAVFAGDRALQGRRAGLHARASSDPGPTGRGDCGRAERRHRLAFRGGVSESDGTETPAGPARSQEASRASAAGQLPVSGRFAQQLEFIVAVDKLKNVLRVSLLTDGSRRENSAEHTWHVALMAMLLREHAPADIDVLHAIRLLLIHDIVEIDAGDTYCYDTEGYSDKEERERQAAVRLFGLLPDDQSSECLALREEFEAMRTPR